MQMLLCANCTYCICLRACDAGGGGASTAGRPAQQAPAAPPSKPNVLGSFRQGFRIKGLNLYAHSPLQAKGAGAQAKALR
eukprot:1158022-Pelagomonas_calceolata.AAC.8